MLDHVGVGHGAENGNIPSTCHPDAHQQDLVPRKKGWWCDPPGVFREWNAIVVDHWPCIDNCKTDYLLIVTANGFRVQIENNLDEWVTGEHVSVAFSQSTYEQKYLAHLKRLKDFDERTKESNIVPRIRRHLLKMARYVTMNLKCTKWSESSYLIHFTGSMQKSMMQMPKLNPQSFRKTISRQPRRNGRISFSLTVRTKLERRPCNPVLGFRFTGCGCL